MLEIIITMVIAVSITLLGVFTMASYLPKQRLLDSVETTEQMLSRAQLEATSRSTWACVKYDDTTSTLTVYMDNSGDHLTSLSACGNSTDAMITSQRLRENVSITSTCGFNIAATPLWFDSAGVPKVCTAVGTCNAQSAQLIVTSSKLPSNNCAREVEAISSGLIAIVPRGELGYDTTVFAKSASQPAGCEGTCTTP